MEIVNLDKQMVAINAAYGSLQKQKSKLFEEIAELSKANKPLSFITNISQNEDDVIFYVWRHKFAVNWDFKKESSNPKKDDYYLKFTISEIQISDNVSCRNEFDSFIMDLKGKISFGTEKFFLTHITTIISLFRLIFIHYFDVFLIEPKK